MPKEFERLCNLCLDQIDRRGEGRIFSIIVPKFVHQIQLDLSPRSFLKHDGQYAGGELSDKDEYQEEGILEEREREPVEYGV